MRVLIVEDDVPLARGLAQSLRDLGFAVDHHRTGLCAAEVALSEPYSLIVLDLILPKVSGFDILRSIRQHGSLAPNSDFDRAALNSGPSERPQSRCRRLFGEAI